MMSGWIDKTMKTNCPPTARRGAPACGMLRREHNLDSASHGRFAAMGGADGQFDDASEDDMDWQEEQKNLLVKSVDECKEEDVAMGEDDKYVAAGYANGQFDDAEEDYGDMQPSMNRQRQQQFRIESNVAAEQIMKAKEEEMQRKREEERLEWEKIAAEEAAKRLLAEESAAAE